VSGVAYAMMNQPSGTEKLYTVNLTTGATTEVGTLGPAATEVITDIVVLPTSQAKFAAAEFTAAEDAGVANVTVSRSDEDGGAASVEWETANVTAVSGADYTASSGTLNWAAGDLSSRTIQVPVSTDAEGESTEDFFVFLTRPSGAWVGTPSGARVRLTDVPPPAPGGGSPTGGGTQTSPPDLTAPLATLSIARRAKIATVARKGLPVAATCDEACTATVQVTVASKTAKKLKLPRRLALLKKPLPAGQRTKLALKPKRATAKRLRRVRRSFKVTVSVGVVDAAGNPAKVKRTVTLRP
jgi:hypothetical protein